MFFSTKRLRRMSMMKRVHGFTLTELMVALVINSVLFIGLIYTFVANLDHYNKVLKIDQLNHQLFTVLELMSNDIRRAGYWSSANTNIGSSTNTNPFMAAGTDISTPSGNSCILFTYDHNSNGTLPAISNTYDDERYGFRLNNQVVQTRPPGATFNCSATSASWENVTDTNNIQITALTFTLTPTTITTGPGTHGIVTRSVTISITGRLASDTTITKTMTMHVRIRNDKYI